MSIQDVEVINRDFFVSSLKFCVQQHVSINIFNKKQRFEDVTDQKHECERVTTVEPNKTHYLISPPTQINAKTFTIKLFYQNSVTNKTNKYF